MCPLLTSCPKPFPWLSVRNCHFRLSQSGYKVRALNRAAAFGQTWAVRFSVWPDGCL